jgi:DNA end-binding protein Ku
MAPRANWKGYLRLSLVSCPIALYPASTLSEKVSFNRINRKTGNRLKQQNVDSETGDVVPLRGHCPRSSISFGVFISGMSSK